MMIKILKTGSILFLVIVTMAASCQLNLRENGSPNRDNEALSSEEVNTTNLQKTGAVTSQNQFSDFLDMIDDVEDMSRSEIDNTNDQEILQLGDPIQQATAGTIYFSDEILQQLEEPLGEFVDHFQTLSNGEHGTLSNRLEEILRSGRESADGPRSKNADEIREILYNWSSDADTTTACGDLFNQLGDHVILSEGENLNIANNVCPGGSNFFLRRGVYSGQSVLSSKQENHWIGLNGAVLDGDDSVYRAFSGGMNQNNIGWIELRNYHLHGIYSTEGSSDVLITKMSFRNIAPDSTGQEYGGIYFENGTGIIVHESSFENLASAIRFRHSNGPLQVIDNAALNTGRNFFQCGNCNGSGIRVTGNSMVRTDSYSIDPLEDWINIFQSNGESTDWIQVNNNRARGHSLSGSGSFIILGDYGGSHQEAVGNIGVNPGQVGIGVAGGHSIKVEANKMFSAAWDSSNVAFYSANYSPSCGNHIFPGSNTTVPNQANWTCGDSQDCNPPALNHAWSDGQCGITNGAIRDSVVVDRSITPAIWNEW